jgi:hypothetical protein
MQLFCSGRPWLVCHVHELQWWVYQESKNAIHYGYTTYKFNAASRNWPVWVVDYGCPGAAYVPPLEFKHDGNIVDGRPWFLHESSASYLWYDADCNGPQQANEYGGSWFFSKAKPSCTAITDVDGNGVCHFRGRSEIPTSAATPPSYADYRVFCGDKTDWSKYPVRITAPGPESSPQLPSAYSMFLHPLPPNTGMSMFAVVPGTTQADNVYWAEKCKLIPTSTTFLVLDMGSVRDFFKPIDGASYCEMLQSNKKHQWSADGVNWVTPDYFALHYGASADFWPRDKGVAGDERKHISFWGDSTHNLIGGCCETATTASSVEWGRTFAMSFAIPLQHDTTSTTTTIIYDPDKRVHWSGYSSTSTDIEVAKKFAGPNGLILVIGVLNAKNVQAYSWFGKVESELMLSPNMEFQTSSGTEEHPERGRRRIIEGGTYIDLTEVPGEKLYS